MTKSETKMVALEDATFAQLKEYAVSTLGLEISHLTKKPASIIAKITEANDEITEIPLTLTDAVSAPAKSADETPAEQGDPEEAEWEDTLDDDGRSLGIQTHIATGKMRRTPEFDVNEREIDPEELMWVSLSEEEGVKTQRHMPISLNGNVILVPRGVRCPLKRKFINVLNDAIKTTYSYDEDTNENISSEAPMVPFSVFGTVKDLGDNYAGAAGEKLLAIVRGQKR